MFFKKKKYIGVGGHLFVIALLSSIKAGYGGVVVGHPTNKELQEHYISNLGADNFNYSKLAENYEYTICLQGQKARDLYDKYTFEEI